MLPASVGNIQRKNSPQKAAPESTPAPVLAAATGGTGSMGSLQALIDPLVANSVLGRSVRVSVVDLRTGTPIYERNPGQKVVPAMDAIVEKLRQPGSDTP